jgi:hypothetical protein
MVAEKRPEYRFEKEAIAEVARICDIRSTETLRGWIRKECSDKRCKSSKKPKKTCTCKCHGAFHGSVLRSSQRAVPMEDQAASPRRTKTLRNAVVTVAVTVAATVTIGYLDLSGTLTRSAPGGYNLSVQVKVDLNKALGALAAVLGLRSTQRPGSSTSGPNYYPDCAHNATGGVQHFLNLHHCKQFATATRTVAKTGTTAQVAFSWVEMPTSSLASQYKATVDTPNTGNPPGVPLTFNGFCYASGQQGATVWSVLVKPTGHVNVDREILQVAAREKFTPSYLRQHCIN